MARLSLLIDVTKCSGCHNCFLACRDEFYDNDYSPYSAPQPADGHFWMQVKEIERGSYPKTKLHHIPVPCMHCETAPCIEAAADEAAYRRPDGIVLIDPGKAKGQRSIVNSCPYRVVFWNADSEIPQKCTLCAHRLDAGDREPRCVEACPTGALVFGDLDDPESDIARLAAMLETEAFHPEYNTVPLVRYVGIPKRFVAGEVVRDDERGECAEGVLVVLEGGGTRRETRTDNYGDFEFEGLEKNTVYRLRFEHSGYAPKTLEVSTHIDVNVGEIVLERVR
jgi:Fe-S-cluster-containing dehydrogenase component